jgi:hypothetical protein
MIKLKDRAPKASPDKIFETDLEDDKITEI